MVGIWLKWHSTKLKADVCVAIVLQLLLSVDVDVVGYEIFWEYVMVLFLPFRLEMTDEIESTLAEVSLKKEYLLSQEYITAIGKHCNVSWVK